MSTTSDLQSVESLTICLKVPASDDHNSQFTMNELLADDSTRHGWNPPAWLGYTYIIIYYMYM